jgi:hypothetical protein
MTPSKPKSPLPPLSTADMVSLRMVFDACPLAVKLTDKNRDRLDRLDKLVLDDYLTAWLVTDVMLYAVTDAGLAALKREGK